MSQYNNNKLTGVSGSTQLLFVQKEIKNIQKNPTLNNTTEFIIDDSDISRFNMIIKPFEGLYQGISVPFELTVPQDYPAQGHPITARCLENIYHPNIFAHGRLCLKYDGIGNLDTGFKESLENLVVAVNYLFAHPSNYGYDGEIMPEHMILLINKNLEAYKNRIKADKLPKSENDPVYKMQEIYGDTINHTLNIIKDWRTYFPEAVYKKEVKKDRYYVFTLGGRKIMDMALLEDVLSQIIRDPRFRFDVVANLTFSKDLLNIKKLTEPITPYSITLSKYKRIIYPNDTEYDPVNSCFNPKLKFEELFDTNYRSGTKTPW